MHLFPHCSLFYNSWLILLRNFLQECMLEVIYPGSSFSLLLFKKLSVERNNSCQALFVRYTAYFCVLTARFIVRIISATAIRVSHVVMPICTDVYLYSD